MVSKEEFLNGNWWLVIAKYPVACDASINEVIESEEDPTLESSYANELIDELSGMKDIIMKIVGRCNINEWNGIKNPQIIIDDYEIIDNMYGF